MKRYSEAFVQFEGEKNFAVLKPDVHRERNQAWRKKHKTNQAEKDIFPRNFGDFPRIIPLFFLKSSIIMEKTCYNERNQKR